MGFTGWPKPSVNPQGDALKFTQDDWYHLLAQANRMEQLIDSHWRIMGEFDTEHRVKLAVDEWGAWHQTANDINPRFLFGYYPTLRDALVSGITLDTFNRHADKVVMANAAQLVNNIHTSFLADGDRFTLTPVSMSSRCMRHIMAALRCALCLARPA